MFCIISRCNTCLHATEPPAAPTIVRVSGVGQRTATLSWRSPINNFPNSLTAVSSYRVTASQDMFHDGNRAVTKRVGTTTHRFTDLEEYTTYSFRVAATNTFGQGPESDALEATTLQAGALLSYSFRGYNYSFIGVPV